MQYLIFADKRFLGLAKKETRNVFGEFQASKEILSDRFFILESVKEKNDILSYLKKNHPIFVDNIALVLSILKTSNEIIPFLTKNLKISETFKIEVLNLGSNPAKNAKSTEVELGEKFEKESFTADLKNPKRLIYVIFTRNEIIIGENVDRANPIDYFRIYNNREDKINRAEFKLREAFEYFDVDIKKIKKAVDIGAAPGGWTKVLAESGVKVVSFDSGALDESLIKNQNVTFIKKRFLLSEIPKDSRFDLLLVDANISPSDSAKLAIEASSILIKNAPLILTLKLIDSRIEKHVAEVMNTLSKDYHSISFKKLPHNRMEITCFAIKR